MDSINQLDVDTIVAIATAPGRGGIGIIRLSGSQASAIAERVCNRQLTPRYAQFTDFKDTSNSNLDSGIAIYFPGPGSFTGEDVVELQAHGGPIILDLIMRECITLGARNARPGEFSERAFLNNKMDLSQAEAIADLINSNTEQAARNATRSLQGEFSNKIHALVQSVTALRVYVEAAIDFPEEEIDFIGDGIVRERLISIIDQLESVQRRARQGSLIREGMKLVITGKPNAGKSSLLNAMSGQNRAIVTSIEGTTRDILHEHINIDGMPVNIVDTAGLRTSDDEIEQEGIRRAYQEMCSADRILLIIDNSEQPISDLNLSELLPLSLDDDRSIANIPVTVIHNKCDLDGIPPKLDNTSDNPIIYLSAKTGDGIELLFNHLKQLMGYENNTEGQFSARRRHLNALNESRGFLDAGLAQLDGDGAGELLAEDLRHCQNSLGDITGVITSDELLGEIFSNFCIGK
ncbi:MAG: tRNA uridine-5-carboxymethylaminomethyl(34) synthesis GTPase MnmE [Halioglobus sp.]